MPGEAILVPLFLIFSECQRSEEAKKTIAAYQKSATAISCGTFFSEGRAGMMRGWQGLVSSPGLFAKIIPGRDLEMTEQPLGIADHPEAPADGQVGHGRHDRFVHLAGEIAVEGFAA